MEPDFRHFDSESPGVQEFISLLLSRRNFLGLSAGAFAGAIAMSAISSEPTQASESPNLTASMTQGANPHMGIDIAILNEL